MKSLFHKLSGFRKSQDGNTAIMFALTLPIVVGAAGLGVETGYWYFMDRELQTAADVAAYAAAVEKRGGSTNSNIDAAALSEAEAHGFNHATGSITVNHPPTSGTHQNSSSVEVILSMPAERFFSAIYSTEEVTLHARGVASYSSGGDACILGLDPTAAGTVTFTGNALTMINGCNVMSNSLANDSLIVSGSADVTVPCVLAAGGTSTDDGLTLTSCTEPQANVPPANDPYVNKTPPTVSGSCLTLPSSNAAATLSPGRYCGGGNLKGTKTFNPGVYIIDGGTFRINASANVSGSGVTFYLTNGATVDFNGTATITLSAPTSGSYRGLLFWGDKNNPYNSNKFNGTAASKLTGAIYLPNQDMEFLGNFSGNNGCLRVVARTVKFTGNTTMNSDCSAAGLDAITLPGRVTLVE